MEGGKAQILTHTQLRVPLVRFKSVMVSAGEFPANGRGSTAIHVRGPSHCSHGYWSIRFDLLFPAIANLLPTARSNGDAAIMTLQSEAGPVLVSTRPAAGPDAIVYFGGNAEDVSLDLPSFTTAFPTAAIYLLHYPGYGGSAGNPTEKSIIAAAFVLFAAVRAQHANVTVIGRSLGTGVAIQVASQRPATRLVLVTPYDSLVDVAEEHYPFLPNRLMMLDKYDSEVRSR